MHLQPDGDIEIKPGELITVSVTAVNTHYLAIFGDLVHGDWTLAQPLHQLPGGGVQEVRTFVAGAGPTEAFSISCDFVRNTQHQINAGAAYQVVITGAGPFRIQKSILPVPPFPIVRPFLFEVRT